MLMESKLRVVNGIYLAQEQAQWGNTDAIIRQIKFIGSIPGWLLTFLFLNWPNLIQSLHLIKTFSSITQFLFGRFKNSGICCNAASSDNASADFKSTLFSKLILSKFLQINLFKNWFLKKMLFSTLSICHS